MATTIKLPELGAGVDSVDVVAVLVSVGDAIEKDQGLIEVETEKASVEVPSTEAGTIKEIHVKEGDVLEEDAPIVTLEVTEDEAGAASGSEAESEAAQETAAVPESVTTPKEESGGEEAAAEKPSRDDEAKPVEEDEEPDKKVVEPSRSPSPPSPVTSRDEMRTIPAAPTVRRFAREVGVDLATVKGSGPGGRISIDDVKSEANRLLSGEGAAGIPQILELPDLERFGPVHREAMTKVRKLTAENLSRAWSTVPQVTNHEIADITDLEEFRKAYKERVAAAGGKLTMTAVLVKIVASALKSHPVLNAAVDMARQEIVFRYSIHIGVAVDTERGLLVPVIRDADQKNLTEISLELDDLASRARSKKLKPDEMQGGTFSISNLGGIGGTAFTPIVNWPEVAILGVSRGRIEAQWYEGGVRPRLMMPFSLSYDHRLVDGADAARFLAKLRDALEQPLLLALDG
jgi:pyruvate dehydrogenase E2 component (dihydrolipoamide acetyltransferase)